MVVVFLMAWSMVSAVPSLIASRDCDSEYCLPSLPQVIDGAGALGNGAAEIFGAGIGVAGTLGGWVINQATGVLEPPATESATSNAETTPEAPNVDVSDASATTPNTDATDATPLFGATLNDNKADPNIFYPTAASEPGPEINVIKPPWKTDECDFASAPPPLLDPNSNVVSHSFFV